MGNHELYVGALYLVIALATALIARRYFKKRESIMGWSHSTIAGVTAVLGFLHASAVILPFLGRWDIIA